MTKITFKCAKCGMVLDWDHYLCETCSGVNGKSITHHHTMPTMLTICVRHCRHGGLDGEEDNHNTGVTP